VPLAIFRELKQFLFDFVFFSTKQEKKLKDRDPLFLSERGEGDPNSEPSPTLPKPLAPPRHLCPQPPGRRRDLVR
jgi:hypothetical protein